jgi:predicted ArsR family transcriptional regulator
MIRPTVRQKVLNFLKKQGSASAAQIARGLKMTAPSVRHHLSILVADGRIVIAGTTGNKRRGRPIKVFGLSEKSLGDNLSLLSSALLNNRSGTIPALKRHSFLHSVAVEIADRIGRLDKNDSINLRLTRLLEKLNEMHYRSRWEAGAEGPRVLFAHCPYATIIDRHPELCQMDGFLIREEMGAKATQLAKIDPKPGGVTHCIFLIS